MFEASKGRLNERLGEGMPLWSCDYDLSSEARVLDILGTRMNANRNGASTRTAEVSRDSVTGRIARSAWLPTNQPNYINNSASHVVASQCPQHG
jgi:hypothetical protein